MNRRRMKENPKVLKRQKKIEKVEGHKSCWVRKKGRNTHTETEGRRRRRRRQNTRTQSPQPKKRPVSSALPARLYKFTVWERDRLQWPPRAGTVSNT